MEGQFNGGFFCVTGLGGLYLEGLIHGGAYFRNFTVFSVHVTQDIKDLKLQDDETVVKKLLTR